MTTKDTNHDDQRHNLVKFMQRCCINFTKLCLWSSWFDIAEFTTSLQQRCREFGY